MTDKQIIIDGVDVSGCICYKATGKYDSCGYSCEETPNCYYKQLKRKELEYERLKEVYADCAESRLIFVNKTGQFLDQLHQRTKELEEKELECENLKNELLSYSTTGICETCTEKSLLENNELKSKIRKLKSGYAELTEIVEPYINDFTGYNEELGCFDTVLCIKELLKEKSDLKEYRLQELEYIRTMLVCLLANEENAKQAYKINHLINEIIKWQNLEDK